MNSTDNGVQDGPHNNIIVVIGRQFGCGGRETGRLIAGRLKAKYYDKTLLSEAAASFGFDRTLFDSADERRPSWIRSLLQYNYGVESALSEMSEMDNESLYGIQSRVIRRLADEGNCVFVGRTADYILRDRPRMLSLFLHAPDRVRIDNIMARKDADTPERAAALMRKIDSARHSYYSYYTNRKWGHADTYHLCIDTSQFSPDTIADIVETYFKK